MWVIITTETGTTKLTYFFRCLEAQTNVPNKALTLLLDVTLAVLKYRGLLLVRLLRLRETVRTVATVLLNKAAHIPAPPS